MQRALRILIPAVIALVIGWFVWPYMQSEKSQAENMHRKFISLGAKRDWDGLSNLIAVDYSDEWDHNREEAVQTAAELLQGFLYLNIEWETTEVTANQGIAKVRGFAKMNGSGGGFSSQIMSTVNAVKEPWVFTWRKESGKPHSWKLVSVKNEEVKKMGF